MSVNVTARKKTIALGAASFLALGGALTLGATTPATAAPIGANALALSEAAPSQVVEVGKRRRGKWRGWRGGNDWGKYAIAGLALGILGSGIRSHYWGYPYGHGYGYGYGQTCHKVGRVIYC